MLENAFYAIRYSYVVIWLHFIVIMRAQHAANHICG